MIDKILSRSSCRSYKTKKVEETKIKKLKQVINSSPTSVNANQFSAIFVTDEKTKKELAELNFGQLHVTQAPLIVVFVADYNRVMYCLKQNNIDAIEKTNNIQSLLIGTTDAVIAASYCSVAALELGLSTCFLGGIRRNIKQVCKILKLKGKSMPIIGLTVGYEDKITSVKPRINKVYDQEYDIKQVQDELITYEQVYKAYTKKTLGKEVGYFEAINKSFANKMTNNNEIEEIRQ